MAADNTPVAIVMGSKSDKPALDACKKYLDYFGINAHEFILSAHRTPNETIKFAQDADSNGRVTGLQASLFDVADPTNPHRVDRFTLKNGHSEVEWDHHAFLHDPATGLTVFPYERWDERKGGPAPTGALVLTVTDDGIREKGTISHTEHHGDWWAPIRRSMLIDGWLVTVSDMGIMLTDADTLEALDWVGF